MPAAVTLGAPALQAKPAPLGVRVILVVVQVNTVAVAMIVAVGGVVFCVMTTLLVAVHPLLPVAVTV